MKWSDRDCQQREFVFKEDPLHCASAAAVACLWFVVLVVTTDSDAAQPHRSYHVCI